MTLDRHVRSALFPHLDDLFSASAIRRSFGRSFVLEVKHDAEFGFPFWLKRFIAEHGLFPEALSKYWTCMTDWRVVHPHSRARGHALSAWLPSQTSGDAPTRTYAGISHHR